MLSVVTLTQSLKMTYCRSLCCCHCEHSFWIRKKNDTSNCVVMP